MKTSTSYPKHHRILAIDAASRTGWATLNNGILECGMQHFQRRKGRKTKEDEHEGVQFSRFEIWFWRLLGDLDPDYVFYEQPAGGIGGATALKCIGWKVLMMACCARKGIPMEGFAAGTLKKYATGSGRAEKPEMIHAVNQKFRGLDITDDNIADAVHVLAYGMSSKYQLEVFG